MIDLLKNADTLRPLLAERAAEIESARRLPPDISKAMAKAGFYRMFVPESLGGLEVSPGEGVKVFESLARGDASSAWIAFIGATSGTALVRLPEDTARAVFADPETLITGVFAASGNAETTEGGFNVNGRWQWGSGSENADWVLGGCKILDQGEVLTTSGGVPRTHMLLFDPKDIEFLDTWHVSGLKGTGSTDYQVTNLFVPEDRAVGYLVTENPDRPLYQFPQLTFLAFGIAAVALGIARAAIDELVALAGSKVRAHSTSAIANRPHTQTEVAKAEAAVRSARGLFLETIEAAWAKALDGQPIPVEQRRDLRLGTTNAVLRSVEAVDAMYNLAGGTSVYETSNLQRYFRDVHVATQHIMVAQATLETIGRLYLGLETNTAML